MDPTPDDIGNVILGVGSLLVIAELIAATTVAPLVLLGKTIHKMTQGKRQTLEQQGTNGNNYTANDYDGEDSSSVDSDDSGLEVQGLPENARRHPNGPRRFTKR